MKKIAIAGALVLAALLVLILKPANSPPPKNISHETPQKTESYWTCPMHPQIRQDHPGECPICHMKLVLKKSPSLSQENNESRREIMANDQQLNLAGIQKHEVENMTLNFFIPVAGRFISGAQVAFQIYESDLRYVKTGLPFKGESGFYPEKEISGIISSIDSIVDPGSRTVRVIGTIKSAGSNIAAESGFRGNIEFTLTNRIAIPESSVLHTGNGDLVYVMEHGMLMPQNVKLGLKSEGFYDVIEGLTAGQFISSGPNFLVDSESKILGTSQPQNPHQAHQ